MANKICKEVTDFVRHLPIDVADNIYTMIRKSNPVIDYIWSHGTKFANGIDIGEMYQKFTKKPYTAKSEMVILKGVSLKKTTNLINVPQQRVCQYHWQNREK